MVIPLPRRELHDQISARKLTLLPIPVATRSKAWVCGLSLAGIVGSNPAEVIDVLSLVNVVCYQVEVFAMSWSLVQRSPTECVVSLCVI